MMKQLLVREALKSPCRYRVAAIGLNRRGVVVCQAHNMPRMNYPGGGLHAEINLLRKNCNISSILLARVSKTGLLCPIEPCKACSKLLHKLGINVYKLQQFRR